MEWKRDRSFRALTRTLGSGKGKHIDEVRVSEKVHRIPPAYVKFAARTKLVLGLWFGTLLDRRLSRATAPQPELNWDEIQIDSKIVRYKRCGNKFYVHAGEAAGGKLE
ncbi:hypothetical protein EVAR_53340_1 [Eumeta japonica]|uniref:Uncharacterized protein n=1 Tax=Eumeta variegata TaxID=151549 RepID=A0A4C1X5W3_EUMVA|nr:hypothetical protein EVAR_53340_1 [Eumeta japonica]